MFAPTVHIPTTQAEADTLSVTADRGDKQAQYAVGQYYRARLAESQAANPDESMRTLHLILDTTHLERQYLDWTTRASEGPDGLYAARIDLGDYHKRKGMLSCVVDPQDGTRALRFYRLAGGAKAARSASDIPFAYAIDDIATIISTDPRIRSAHPAQDSDFNATRQAIKAAIKDVLIEDHAPSLRHGVSSGFGYLKKILAGETNHLGHLRSSEEGIRTLAGNIAAVLGDPRRSAQKGIKDIIQAGVSDYIGARTPHEQQRKSR